MELLRKLKDGEPLVEEEVVQLETALGMSLLDVQHALDLDGEADEGEESEEEEAVEPEVQEPVVNEPTHEPEPRIVVTSLVGAKGLQACHVFVVGVNERHFPWANSSPTNDEVCRLIVALTRATKCCYLVSCGRFGADQVGESIFMEWLKDFTERVDVNAAYFDS